MKKKLSFMLMVAMLLLVSCEKEGIYFIWKWEYLAAPQLPAGTTETKATVVGYTKNGHIILVRNIELQGDTWKWEAGAKDPSALFLENITCLVPAQHVTANFITVTPSGDGQLWWDKLGIDERDEDGIHRFKSLEPCLGQVCVELDHYNPTDNVSAYYSMEGTFNCLSGEFEDVKTPSHVKLFPKEMSNGVYTSLFSVVPQTFVKDEVLLNYEEKVYGVVDNYVYNNAGTVALKRGETYHVHPKWPDDWTKQFVPVVWVGLDKDNLDMIVGDDDQLIATVGPENATNKDVVWSSSDESIVKVDAEGNVVAVGVGVATITVTTVDGNKTATCTITVSPSVVSVTDVTLDSSNLDMIVGDEDQLIATVGPENATNKDVVWSSSDESIVKVDAKGNVVAVGVGVATITVTTVDGNKTATCTVTVSPSVVSVTDVTLDSSNLDMIVGDEDQLIATIGPADATNKDVVWSSSDESIVKVDADGNVVAVGVGVATITVTTVDGNKTATCTVMVSPSVVSVTDVSLDSSNLDMIVGDEDRLIATVGPADATNKDVVWSSSDESIVKVDADGNVVAVGVGVATITVTTVDGNKTATCTVTVSPSVVSVTDVTLDSSNLDMIVGDEDQLIATVGPADATNKDVVWSSSDESIVKVDADGNVVAVGVGVATITVTTVDGNKTATCTVMVSPSVVSVTDVSLNSSNLDMIVGDEDRLIATVGPADATNKDVIWSSSDESVVKVDAEGNVVAVGVGVATITVTTVDGNKTATCTVTVSPVAVIQVILNKNELSLKEGESETLIATILPDNADNKKVYWDSNNKHVATVDENGKVTAVKAGEAYVTVKTDDGGKTATCKVLVTGMVSGGTDNENMGGEGNGNIEWD